MSTRSSDRPIARPAEHDSTLDAELDAQLYATRNHPGVVFEVEHRIQLHPSN